MLIVRDLMVRGYTTFRDFQNAGEKIATNVLSDRLRKLKAAGIIMVEAEPSDGRRAHYRLTEKGISLAPVLLELFIWGARHKAPGTSCSVLEQMESNRDWVLGEARRRWEARDATPLLPRPEGTNGKLKLSAGKKTSRGVK